jgi:hypothetical protein
MLHVFFISRVKFLARKPMATVNGDRESISMCTFMRALL